MSLEDPATLELFLKNIGAQVKEAEDLLSDIKKNPSNYDPTLSYKVKQELAVFKSIYLQASILRAPKTDEEKKEGE
jgi:hypothetical protein